MTTLTHQDPLLSAIVSHHGLAPHITSQPKFWFWIIEENGPAAGRVVLISDIQKAVAEHFGITTHDLLSDCRSRREVLPRHIAIYLCRTLTRRSHEMIARWFNRCDHSISIFAFNKISRLIKERDDIADDIAEITKVLA